MTDLAAQAQAPELTSEQAAQVLEGATPMLRQYLETKARVPDAILLFRVGDFFEVFYEDAKTAAELLGITLTSRPTASGRVPMCGVPHHAVNGYVGRLVEAGLRVALCDQVEEPQPGKALVRREITRIVTPGTVFDEEGRDAKAPAWIAGVALGKEAGGALALIEATTGDFRVFVAQTDGELFEELARAEPKEHLLEDGAQALQRLPPVLPGLRALRAPADFDARKAKDFLCDRFDVKSLDGFGLGTEPLAWSAAGAVLRYAEETQRSRLEHVRGITRYEPAGALLIDAASRRNLELVRNATDGRKAGSLLATIDKTATSMGGRLLQQWLAYPLVDVADITARQDAVQEFVESAVLREDVAGTLREVGDLERLVARLVVGQGNARDLRLLGLSFARLPELQNILDGRKAALLRSVVEGAPDLSDLATVLDAAVLEEPKATTREGGMFRPGYHAELDELLTLAIDGKNAIARMESQERERTGIQSLKIRHNRVFGYFIEVTKANLANVPDDYVRKQTTANGERYVTPWLQEFEGKVLTAQERSIALEAELFEELRLRIVARASEILDVAKRLATLDVLASFARIAADYDYRRPTVTSGDLIRIFDGRHPVVERVRGAEPFVPNDIELDHDRRLVVLTGPNMAGKSTAMRQVAHIVILAQMGAFVPAREAVIGICDRLFTRVGAGDDLARGQSTFMVEMTETANILRHATSRSLVLLDEIGRGTSTFDGLAIAWAVAEHILDQVRARTIFATHYHELTQLAFERDQVVNLTMAVREWGERITFLRKLVAGAASRSYGIHVAKLAGVPPKVLARAKEVLANLEKAGTDDTGHAIFARAGRRHARAQLALGFDGARPDAPPPAPLSSPVLDELDTLDVDKLTPLDALQILHRWRKLANDDVS